MAAVTVLVTFYSRGGETETLAHAAAVGAVQGRALIRLRRIADLDPQATLARYPASSESLHRMSKEYVAPKEADVLAADALILASPADVDAASDEWAPYFALLARLHADGKLAGKAAAVIPNGATSDSFTAMLERFGLLRVTYAAGPDDVNGAMALGRQAAAAATRPAAPR
jgi:NAD(P)H dehydrogenase (quinone)